MGQVQPEKCKNGHLYNPNKHSYCPHCRNPQRQDRQETRTVAPDSTGPLNDDETQVIDQGETRSSDTPTNLPGPRATMVDTGTDRSKPVGETGVDDQERGEQKTVILSDIPGPSSDTPTGLDEAVGEAQKLAAPKEPDRAPQKGKAAGMTRLFGEEEPEEIPVKPVLGWLVIWEGKPQYHVFRMKEQTLIGKSSECDLVFSDEYLSSEHASIRYRDNKFVITDLDSSNGTFVNDREHKNPIDRVELSDGDEIIVGDTILKFKCILY